MSLLELVSPGKSGSFFYISLDYKFVIKTITEGEAETFLAMLRNYYQHCMQNPNTLLCKFFGLYMVQPRGVGKEMYFVVMENAFPPSVKIDEKYDLKVSIICALLSV
jgi:1-phosphatidylinositol-4-phosphate 5-kinase